MRYFMCTQAEWSLLAPGHAECSHPRLWKEHFPDTLCRAQHAEHLCCSAQSYPVLYMHSPGVTIDPLLLCNRRS